MLENNNNVPPGEMEEEGAEIETQEETQIGEA